MKLFRAFLVDIVIDIEDYSATFCSMNKTPSRSHEKLIDLLLLAR